jgi:hypothetical protein
MRNEANYLSGIPLEKQLTCWLMQKMHLGNLVQHNDFNPKKYPNENSHIVDVEVTDKILVECTNPKETTWMDDDIMLNKLDYFTRKDPTHLLIWVLLVSFANFSEFIKCKITEMNIILVEMGIHADKTSHCQVVKQLFKTQLYGLIKRLFKSKFAPVFRGNNTLDKHMLHTANITKAKVDDNNNLHQHSNIDSNNEFDVQETIERAKRLGLFYDYNG